MKNAKIPILALLTVAGCVASSAAGTPADDAIEAHATALRDTVPRGFHVVVEKPFVVIGNQSKGEVKRRARGTVRWAVSRLKKDFFSKDPDHIIDIWLFKDAATYRYYAKELFGDSPDTPYGYYSELHQALIMNIATGGGTLVHEIVHPFVAANFPECPPWFNEGLGSLYEHSTGRNGQIWGLTNWRLRGLKAAIRQGAVPSFKTLTAMNESQFYNEDSGTNYAQARYLLQYLQEKELLRKFYHAFYKARATDPTGYRTLMAILETEDMDAFKTKWEKWVNSLRLD